MATISKRQAALNTIFYEVARHGEVTATATRTFIENRICFAAYHGQVNAGLRHRETCTNAACPCKAGSPSRAG